MFNLLRNAHDRAEELQGRKLIVALVVIFVTFTFVGFGFNYFTDTILKSPETVDSNSKNGRDAVVITQYKGVITYVNPQNYPLDDISFYLADIKGKQIILLKATDQKLEVSEGLFVTVSGKLTKTSDGKNEILVVDTVSVSNN